LKDVKHLTSVTATINATKKVKVCGSLWKPISELQSVTCHIGSDSVTCHMTQVNVPCLNPSTQAGARFTCARGTEGWVDLGGWLYTEMVYLSTDSHPSK